MIMIRGPAKALRDKIVRISPITKLLLTTFYLQPKWFRVRSKVSGIATCKVESKEFKWCLEPSDLISYFYAANGFKDFEPITMRYVLELVSNIDHSLQSFHVLNIGANVGVWPFVISKKAPDFEFNFTLIEPSLSTTENLKKNMHLNDIDVQIHSEVISDRFRSICFENNRLVNAYSKVSNFENEVRCAIPLDSLEINNPNLVICDVEGHEFQVLSGALSTLSKYMPIVIVELSPQTYSSVTQLMKGIGYGIPIWLGIKNQFSAGEKNFLFLPARENHLRGN